MNKPTRIWLRVTQFRTPAMCTIESLLEEFKKRHKLNNQQLQIESIERSSWDLRRKGSISWNFILSLPTTDVKSFPKIPECQFIEQPLLLIPPKPEVIPQLNSTPLIIGAGITGLTIAWLLCRAGIPPKILERGPDMETRIEDVKNLHAKGILKKNSNVQFGLGGAGTFSDGKLNSRTKHPCRRYVLEWLHSFGAPKSIIHQSAPHAGTDCIRKIVMSIKEDILTMGGEFLFNHHVADLVFSNKKVSGLVCSDGKQFQTDTIFLCPGNAARELFRSLNNSQVALQAQTVAMGFRIEHEQALLNRLIYRERHLQEYFGAASWSMRSNDLAFPAWSFCVCPGGILVNSSTTEQGMVVNGMSFSGRGGSYINGALVSPISPSAKASPLEILEIQESFEEKSASFAPGEQRAPAQEARDFLQDQPSQKLRRCTFRPGVVSANLSTIYPTKVIASLRGCIKQFDQRFEGFSDGILVGAETRTSSPVRIVRGDNGQSVSHEGLYPCGEGAGYAGGILTSALDGVTAYLNFLKLDPIGVPGTNHFKESPIE